MMHLLLSLSPLAVLIENLPISKVLDLCGVYEFIIHDVIICFCEEKTVLTCKCCIIFLHFPHSK